MADTPKAEGLLFHSSSLSGLFGIVQTNGSQDDD